MADDLAADLDEVQKNAPQPMPQRKPARRLRARLVRQRLLPDGAKAVEGDGRQGENQAVRQEPAAGKQLDAHVALELAVEPLDEGKAAVGVDFLGTLGNLYMATSLVSGNTTENGYL